MASLLAELLDGMPPARELTAADVVEARTRANDTTTYVVLDDDTTCAVASHDHGQHWQGRFSWYPCRDGSELLADEMIEDTFDSDADAWTVDRSVDQGKPTSTRVKTAVYAGTR